jgi:hypothetical protein
MKDPAAPQAPEKDPVLPAPRTLGAVPWTGPGAAQQGRTRAATVRLGYLLAGPRDRWVAWPPALLLAMLVPMSWAGWGAARPDVLDVAAPEVSGASPGGARTPAASAGPAGPAGH